jgi:hypothetical protein
MGSGSRPGRLTALSIAAVGTLSLACGSSLSPAASGTTLPRNVIVPLSAVSRFFPEITRETSTGRDLTATGNPKATRMVIYESGDGSKRVTITVDQYGSSRHASSAYQQAVEKSQSVPGFKPVPVPTVGQQTFAGTATVGAETHIGLGALDRKLMVGATLAGYDATPDNITKLVALARMQGAAAKRAVGPSGSDYRAEKRDMKRRIWRNGAVIRQLVEFSIRSSWMASSEHLTRRSARSARIPSSSLASSEHLT